MQEGQQYREHNAGDGFKPYKSKGNRVLYGSALLCRSCYAIYDLRRSIACFGKQTVEHAGANANHRNGNDIIHPHGQPIAPEAAFPLYMIQHVGK